MIPAELKSEKKFIIYELTASISRPGKLDKKPCWDWSNSTLWMHADDAERAAAQRGTDYGVGYVITDDSGRFFFDIDGCRNPRTGELSKIALDVMALFPLAYKEGSVSLTGVHILGRYQGPRPEHGCKKYPLGPRTLHRRALGGAGHAI